MMLLRVILCLTMAYGAANAASPTPTLPADEPVKNETPAKATPSAASPQDVHLPGVALSEAVSQVTGTAISPLLGVSAVGAWKYIQTPENQRHLLPWYCHPWSWGSGFFLLTLVFLKDFLGTAAPGIVKKPLDFAELFEDKASALVASTAFVPLVALAMAQVNAIPLAQPTAMASSAELGFASVSTLAVMDNEWVRFAVYTPVLMLCFVVVWLSSHAINVLIALSPFSTVDAVLKLSKLGLLVTVTAASFIHPLLGLVICIPIIALAAYLSGWAFRFGVFGTLFGWDLLLSRRVTEEDVKEGVRCFTARKLHGVPVRTYGTLKVNELGMHVFRHRRWLVATAQELTLEQPLDGVTKGMLHPTLTRRDMEGRARATFLLAPRYRSSEEHIGTHLGIQEITDSSLRRGLKAVKVWFTEAVSMGKNLMERSSTALPSTRPVPRLH